MTLNILSLGAGVQSSTMALMAVKGEIEPMPDAAIFADTGAEPRGVYDWLDWLEKQLPFPVYRVMKGRGLLAALMSKDKSKMFAAIPFITVINGRLGMARRQCTREFKIEPINKKIRILAGLKPRQRTSKGDKIAIVWVGISTDEIVRMTDNRIHYLENRWPLIEKRMSRQDCLRWMEGNGFPQPVKSACTFCPYHDDATWRDMKMNDTESWDQAVMVDRFIRKHGNKRFDGDLYIHRSGRPLEEVDLRNAEDMGQQRLFLNECEGMCGV